MRGAAATMVDLAGPQSLLFHVLHARDPRAGKQVYSADATSWEYVTSEREARA